MISTVDIGRPRQASELFQKYAKLSKKVGQQDALPGLCVTSAVTNGAQKTKQVK